MSTARNRSPFTASQWEELEHQALIFKHMVSGVPIPTDLLSTVKRSLDSSLSSRLLSLQPMGRGYYQMGYGKKPDPEPGRCRRTDGKKWRCSKEAYPDSKYCERHMHRGRNRSRKPVELINSSADHNLSPSLSSPSICTNSNSNITTTTTISSSSAYTPSPTPFSSSMPFPSQLQYSHQLSYRNSLVSPSIYPHSSTHHTTNHRLFLGSGLYHQADKDPRRSLHGVREAVDERSFFPETSGNLKSLHDSVTPLTMKSSSDYSGFNFQSPGDAKSDIKTSTSSIRIGKAEDQTQKPFHHFFNEWPPKSREHSWIDVGKNQSNNNVSLATTQLSISMPLSTQELFQTNSRPY